MARKKRKPSGTITDDMRAKAKAVRLDPTRICGAFAPRSKDGICHEFAGAGTDHKGEGYCYRHDPDYIGPNKKRLIKERPEHPRQVDLSILADEQVRDPDILELRREIRDAREQLSIMKSEGESGGVLNPRDYALLLDTVRKLVLAKNKIELERRYLIPVSVTVNAANAVVQVVAEFLPIEQRYALRDRVKEALRTELAMDSEGNWMDPSASWASRLG